MPGPKTNEREGTRAVLRHARVSPYKVREVLDLIRGEPVQTASEILRFSERDVAIIVGKLLASAVANAEQNDQLEPDDLYVSACFADEGTTIKRWRPRARGRATRIRKRTSHITIIVSRLPEDQLLRLQGRRQAEQSARRARRVAGARKAAAATTAPGRSRLGRRRVAGSALPAAGAVDEVEQSTADLIDRTDVDETELAGPAGTQADAAAAVSDVGAAGEQGLEAADAATVSDAGTGEEEFEAGEAATTTETAAEVDMDEQGGAVRAGGSPAPDDTPKATPAVADEARPAGASYTARDEKKGDT
jgi:large subunit ribosomal protein L22